MRVLSRPREEGDEGMLLLIAGYNPWKQTQPTSREADCLTYVLLSSLAQIVHAFCKWADLDSPSGTFYTQEQYLPYKKQ